MNDTTNETIEMKTESLEMKTENLDEMESVKEEVIPILLEENYKPPSQLFIPPNAIEKFAAQGFELQWARVYVPRTQGELDLNNISKKEADGFEFVTRDEIPGLKDKMSSYFGDKIDTHGGLYIVGDQALVKIPYARVALKRKYIDKRTISRSKAVMADLRNNQAEPSRDRNEGIMVQQERPQSRDVDFGK